MWGSFTSCYWQSDSTQSVSRNTNHDFLDNKRWAQPKPDKVPWLVLGWDRGTLLGLSSTPHPLTLTNSRIIGINGIRNYPRQHCSSPAPALKPLLTLEDMKSFEWELTWALRENLGSIYFKQGLMKPSETGSCLKNVAEVWKAIQTNFHSRPTATQGTIIERQLAPCLLTWNCDSFILFHSFVILKSAFEESTSAF